MNLHLRARGALAAASAVAVVATAMGATAPTRARAVPNAAERPAITIARSLLLVTGDRLTVRWEPDGRSEMSVRPAAPDHGGLVSLRRGGVTDMIPADALPYLGRGLDPSLFDIPLLLRAEAGGRLPVRITFSGRRPALPGMTVTRSGPGTAQGYLTSPAARSFGLALMRQFRSDHARGSLGGGLFAGGMTLALAGAPASSARPAAATHTLTVTGRALSGKPDSGDVVWVFSADNMNGFIGNTGAFHDGVAKFSVPAGRYWVTGEFDSSSPASSVTRLDLLPQVSVAQDTTVHTAASAATSEVTMTTPRPAVSVEVTFTADFTDRHGSTASVDWFDAPGHVWVSPTRRKSAVGTLQAYATEQLASAGPAGTPYAYNLNYADPPGIIPSQHYVARASNLATVTETYFQDMRSTGAWITWGAFPGEQLLTRYIYPLHLPGRQVHYFSAAPGLLWSPGYGAVVPAGGGFPSGGQADDTYRSLPAGANLVVDWNQYPLHPQPDFVAGAGGPQVPPLIPAAIRAGNTLTLTMRPFSDNVPGHLSAGSVTGTTVTDSYQIDQNGAQVARGNADDGIPPVTVSAKPSVIRFTLNAARTGPAYVLSTRTKTVWTWRSRRQPRATVPLAWYCAYVLVHGQFQARRRCAVQSLMTLAYDVRGLALNGTAPAGPQLIGLTVGHLQLARATRVTGATARVSCDGGRHWRRATTTASGGGRFRIGFRVSGGCHVTLRVSAADAAGGSVTETITRAYDVARH